MPASFRHHLSLMILAGLALTSMGCVHHVHQHPARVVTKSPPPWAPAHGHRRVHQQRTLIFDTNLDCYTVVGHSDHFFHHDHYYRWRAERWERSLRAAGPWRAVELDRLPQGLRGWHTRHHAARLEREVRSAREHQRARDERLARQQWANERARERAQEARRLEREDRRVAERLEREREKRRAERREQEREQRHAEARLERERDERRVADHQRQERTLALRERDVRKLEALEHRRAEERKRKAGERKRKVKDQEPAEHDYRARRRAGKEHGVRSDEKQLVTNDRSLNR